MSRKIRPLYDRIVVKRLEDAAEKTLGGIIIPDQAKERATIGEVIAVGAGRVTDEGKILPLQVKTGDTVFFGKYSGTDAGDDLLIIREEEILGLVER